VNTSLHQDFNELLTRFKEDENKWENHTKAEYIKRCDDIITAQINASVIDIKEGAISSYLFKKLNEFGINVSERTIQRNIPEHHKRNYSKSDILSDVETEVWQEIETEDQTILIEKNQYNDFKINGVEQRAKEIQKIITPEEPKPEDKDTRQFVYLSAISKLSNKFHLTLETLKNRYNMDPEVQKIIDSELGDVEKKLTQYALDWASIENSKNMIDLRRDWGEYEKIMGTFMINTGETIARIAQIMDYSEKYGSIGLLREPKVTAFFESETKYPLYLRSCPVCYNDISVTMNRNISLWRECERLGIEFTSEDLVIPTIKYK